MNIQNHITELQNLGYHLYLDGGQLRYKCHALIEPPKDKVIPLLETLKRNREAVIDYLKGIPEAFDPNGLLSEVIGFWQDRYNGNESCIEHISQMVSDGLLKPPYGFKVKDSPVIGGDYWIVSCNEAKARIPSQAMTFTVEEAKLITKACHTFNGKVVEVIKH